MGNRESECLWLRHVHVPLAGSPCCSWCMCMMQFQAPPSPLKGGRFNHTRNKKCSCRLPPFFPTNTPVNSGPVPNLSHDRTCPTLHVL
jgi:hypothetical protein